MHGRLVQCIQRIEYAEINFAKFCKNPIYKKPHQAIIFVLSLALSSHLPLSKMEPLPNEGHISLNDGIGGGLGGLQIQAPAHIRNSPTILDKWCPVFFLESSCDKRQAALLFITLTVRKFLLISSLNHSL